MTTPDESAAISERPWWAETVGYQIYIRSFADSDGNGVGDLNGINDHLGYLELLGVQTIWITPFYPSPMADAGYDVSDPRGVDPTFGSLADFDELVAEAHGRGIRVLVDIVPNHSSQDHVWFQEALAAAPGSLARDRYIFRDGRGESGELPPNNWQSVFGGPAWARVPDGQWYLHIFAPEQPDFNWENPEVRADLATTLRFWLDRHVDGFRLDVAHGMAKPAGLPDAPAGSPAAGPIHHEGGVIPVAEGASDPRFDNDGVHEIHRFIRKVVDEYPDRATVGEVWVADPGRFASYLRPDELHQAFTFGLIGVPFEADKIQEAIITELDAHASVSSYPAWTLSNHDLVRPVTRYGGGAVGTARSRAMMLVEMALPGAFYLYNGEELGLPSVDIPDEALQDPTWLRSGGAERGRDSSRLPMPWEDAAPPFGFSSSAATWLPSPVEYGALTAELQFEDADSTLSLVRQAIEIRTSHEAFSGNEVDWYVPPAGCLAFRRLGGLICALNTTSESVALPPGEILLSSAPMDGELLPANSAVWMV